MTTQLFYIIGLVLVAIQILGIVYAAHAVLSVRTSQGTIAWVMALIMFPVIGLPLYLIFGRNRFHGYTEALRQIYDQFHGSVQTLYSQLDHFHLDIRHRMLPLQQIARDIQGVAFLRANQLTILIDGEQTFGAMLEAIKQAQRYICFQSYIFRQDKISDQFKDALIERAQAGVMVFFLYDEIGCYSLKEAYLDGLRQAGVKVSAFQSTRGVGNRFQINFRNHRKLLIVDGEQGFLGGFNIGDEYLGRAKKFGPWRDTHLQIKGPSVQAMQIGFAKDWFWASHELPELNWQIKPERANQNVMILPTGPADTIPSAMLMMINIINQAHHRLWIASPYFVPNLSVIAALHLAALRGVDVRIILPSKADHLLVYLCSFAYYRDLNNTNIRLYRYRDGFMHQKVVLVDDKLAGIGTVNLDNRSLRINFEVTALSTDEKFVSEVKHMLQEDLTVSYLVDVNEFKTKSLWFRIVVHFARLFAPLL